MKVLFGIFNDQGRFASLWCLMVPKKDIPVIESPEKIV